MPHPRSLNAAVILLLGLLLGACGGGGSSDSSPEPTPPATGGNSTPQVSLEANQGQALLGPIVDATVNVYEAEDFNGAVICSTTTTSLENDAGPGIIDLSSCAIDETKVYFLVVSGGMDIDTDDDGVLDTSPTPKTGDLRGIVSGSDILEGNFRLNIVTELAYQSFSDKLFSGATATDIAASLDNVAQRLLQEDINGDGIIDNLDLLDFQPASDNDALPTATRGLLEEILSAILSGDKSKVTRLSREYLLASLGEFTFTDFFGFEEPSYNASFIVNDNLLYRLNYIPDDGESPSYYEFHIAVMDIDDLTDIRILGEARYNGLPATSYAGDYYLRYNRTLFDQDTIYTASNISGILSIDISDPSNPTVSHALDGQDYSRLTKGPGNILFAGNINQGTSPTVSIVDVSNPETPAPISSIDTSGAILYAEGILYSSDAIYEIDTDGKTTLLSNTPGWEFDELANEASIKVYDVSNPAAPTPHDTISGFGFIREILIDGDKLYATTSSGNDDGDYSISTFDITAPGELQLLDSRSIQGDYEIDKMEKDGNRIYFSGFNAFYVYDADAFNNRTSHLAFFPTSYSSEKIKIVGNTAFVVDTQQLTSIDISNPQEGLVELHSILLPDWVHDMVIVGDYAYLAAYMEGLVIVDISNPRELAIVGSNNELNILGETTRTWTSSVAVSGNYAFTSTYDHDLGVFDINNPSDPTLINTLEIPFDSQDSLAINNSYLYRVTDDSLDIYNIAEANSPFHDSSMPLVANTIEVAGDYAYTTSYTSGLTILGAGNARTPVIYEGILGLGRGNAIAVNGNQAYVANEFGFVEAYDTSDKTRPELQQLYQITGTVNDVAVTDDFIFAVNGFGVVVERTVDPSIPVDAFSH